MGQGQGRSRCALWGGISLGVGTFAYAFFSPSSAGCSTNWVVLNRGELTERSCAAFSVMSHTGVGLMVLGAVLLLGSFALALRVRRQVAMSPIVAPTPAAPVEVASESVQPATGQPAYFMAGQVAAAGMGENPDVVVASMAEPDPTGPRPIEPEPTPVATRGPIAPGEDVDEPAGAGLSDLAVRLPPGWYGNPDVPGKPVQWWDGTKLTDGP